MRLPERRERAKHWASIQCWPNATSLHTSFNSQRENNHKENTVWLYRPWTHHSIVCSVAFHSINKRYYDYMIKKKIVLHCICCHAIAYSCDHQLAANSSPQNCRIWPETGSKKKPHQIIILEKYVKMWLLYSWWAPYIYIGLSVYIRDCVNLLGRY